MQFIAVEDIGKLVAGIFTDPAKLRAKTSLHLARSVGEVFEVKPPFRCDCGCHIYAQENLYINYDCMILDCNEVHFGKNVLLAPRVQIYTAYHPLDPGIRSSGLEMAAPIVIGDDVWIGGGAIICPGVTLVV
jgi:maltose O-acetyltransferase